MSIFQKLSLVFMRVTIGWLCFYAGITKVLDPQWSSAGYLKGAKTATWFYQWLIQPDVLPVVNFLNKWGLTLLGISLIFGIFVRLSSTLGAGLMFLYYLPVLTFPYIAPHSFLVDEHIIYIAVMCVLCCFRAGRVWGLDAWCLKLPLCSKYPKLRALIG
ncbi:MAG: DoxX family membrane protein [Patescibacteria group bacterium]